jgi:hypothetical protein
MAAELARGAAGISLWTDRSIDDVEFEIRRLARQMNAETYRMLLLVRDFDDRFGFARWGLRSCAEWLAWSCGLSLSAAREKVRTAQALRTLPAISAAFADGGFLIRRCARSRASRTRPMRICCSRTRSKRARRKSKSGADRCVTPSPNR